MKIKVCGMRDAVNIKEISSLEIDFMGFIFYKESKRYVGKYFNKQIINHIPNTIKKIGVFVNSEIDEILEIKANYNLDFVQLHGNESPFFCDHLKQKGVSVIKVFSIKKKIDFHEIKPYIPYCEYFLFDTQTKNYGGSGKKFNWEILKNYHYDTPIFLSGGIAQEDVQNILKMKLVTLFAIDINSRFEVDYALKDTTKVKDFVVKVKKIDSPI